MKKLLAGVAIFITGIVCGLIFAYGPLCAQVSAGEGDIMTKLEDISKNQEDMMASIDSIKEDLRIIKIRVTQSQ